MMCSIFRWVLLTCCVFLAIYHRECIELATSAQHIFKDTDDAMRLVQVRDWLAGQSWWDMRQYRLYPEAPIIMHWSRLIDVPIAGLILIFKPFVGQFQAELITRVLWPLLLFSMFSVLYFKLCLKLAGQGILLYAATLLVLNVYVTAQFAPGRIDHHSVQLVCTMACLWLMFGAFKTPRNGLILGLILALMLTIGYETAPLVAGIIVVLVLAWVIKSGPLFMRYIGLGLLIGLNGLYFATHSVSQFWQQDCDAIAMPGLVLFGGAGLVISVLSMFQTRNWQARLSMAIIGGAGCVVALIIMAPQCLLSPYDVVDPILKTQWLAHVQEAQPLLKALSLSLETSLPLLMYGLIGFSSIIYCIKSSNNENKLQFIFYLVIYIIAFITTAWQIRGGYFLLAIAMPAICFVINHMRLVYASQLTQALVRMGIMVLCVPYLWVFAYKTVHESKVELITHHAACSDSKAIDALKAQPKGLVLAPMDIGPDILAMTDHSVLAAPYHRNNQGNLLNYKLVNMQAERKNEFIKNHNIQYEYLCTIGNTEKNNMRNKNDQQNYVLYESDRIQLIIHK